ncbi:hypothetical protein [uncultured Pseudacidovorax sp.]|uniref:hypothetical protein n=1 Tax=uncultured Pseudacidovorax sp. TaxID=679313 RepID=UPI0025FEC214|nr:hypothetical protein [uncultured Pseudacidovorax sp.]
MAFDSQGAQAGAAVGAAVGSVVPVIGTALGGAIGTLAGGFLGGGGGSGGGSSGGGSGMQPMSAQAAAFGSGLDGSGWQVIFGNGNSASLDNRQDKRIDATGQGPVASANQPQRNTTTAYDPYLYGSAYGGGLGLDLGGGVLGVPLWAWAIFIGGVAWRMSKSGK